MRIIQGLESFPPEGPGTVVALGVFDGVHLGHRAILGTARARGGQTGLEAVACTFDPHPLEVLEPERAPVPLTTLDERLELIAEVGVDAAVVVGFTPELARMEPETFVKDVLLGRLRAREVVLGFNHTFGRGARGDARLLQELGERLGFKVHVIPPLLVDGVQISSSAIREALERGDVARAGRYLGRPYSVAGGVVEGAGRGRALGFPTANLRPERRPLVGSGVYACRAQVGATRYPAVVNVGTRPTFGETAVVVEAHLLDFQGVLYGQRLRLEFVERLRDERRFPSPEALREQIGRDIEAARRRL